MVPEPGQRFKRRGHRGEFVCREVRDGIVHCFGGSTDPWGKRGFRSFRADEDFLLVREKEKAQ